MPTTATAARKLLAEFRRNTFPASGVLTWTFKLEDAPMIVGFESNLGAKGYAPTLPVRIANKPAGFFGKSIGAEMKRRKNLFVVILRAPGGNGQVYLRTPEGWKCAEVNGTMISVMESETSKAIIDAGMRAHGMGALGSGADARCSCGSGSRLTSRSRKVIHGTAKIRIDMEDETDLFTTTLREFVEANKVTGAGEEVAAWVGQAKPGSSRVFGGGAASTYTITLLSR